MDWERMIINSISEGVMVIDTDLTIMFANKAVNSIGLNYESIIGKSIYDVFPNLVTNQSTFVKVLETGKENLNNQQTFVTYRGEKNNYDINISNNEGRRSCWCI